MSKDPEEWLRQQLDLVAEGIDDQEAKAKADLVRTIPMVIRYNQEISGGRYDIGIAHLLLALAYAIDNGLDASPKMREVRTKTNDELKALAFEMTWADSECFFGQFGVALWATLWKGRR